ncbi:MAG: ABC transporter substrate-binding protein [Candidatus Melainabacteria bacterium]|nr:ABC transporter substrate-binding protein [Candidatus Melainabacteria bacterium]
MKFITYVLLIVLFFTSCSSNKLKNEKNLRLGYMPNVTHATALIGIEKNIFQDELTSNIKLKLIHFVVGNSIIDAFITNQIDIAYVGPGPFINALYRKVPIKLLAGACNGGTTIVETLRATSLQEGSRIAIPQYGNTQDLLLRLFLEKNNLTDKVKIIAIPPQDTGTAFFTMSIDAACLPEPWGIILIKKGVCKLLIDEKSILNGQDYPVTLLIVNKKYAEEHPDLVEKFLNAHKKINEFIIKNPKESIEIVTKAISNISKKQIDSSIIKKSFDRCKFENKVNLNLLNKFKEIGVKAGYYENYHY